MRFWRALGRGSWGALALALAASACGGETPITPTPQPPPVIPAPIINSVTVATTRAEAGLSVNVAAEVVDGAPGVGALTYQWSANYGAVTVTGPGTGTWRLEKGVISAGVDVVVSLTVTKPYQVLENGQLLNREHRVTRASTAFRAHDSEAELRRITLTFLIDYFGDSRKSPDECLVDFSTNCRGRADEFTDIFNNRKERLITSAQASVKLIELNSGNTFAWITAPCAFSDIDRVTGKPSKVSGACLLTAVYEQQRWWLCSSNFDPNASFTLTPFSAVGLPERRYWDRIAP